MRFIFSLFEAENYLRSRLLPNGQSNSSVKNYTEDTEDWAIREILDNIVHYVLDDTSNGTNLLSTASGEMIRADIPAPEADNICEETFRMVLDELVRVCPEYGDERSTGKTTWSYLNSNDILIVSEQKV